MKYAILSIGLLAALIAGGAGYDIYDDGAPSIEVLAATPLLAEAHPQNYGETQNDVVATLAEGARPTVLRIRYGKDYMAIRVRTDSNVEGWVIFGPTIRVRRR